MRLKFLGVFFSANKMMKLLPKTKILKQVMDK